MTCGLTFTFGGLKITNEGEVESTDGRADPRPVRRRRAGGRAVLSQLSRRHGPGVRRGAGQAGGRRRGTLRQGQELGGASSGGTKPEDARQASRPQPSRSTGSKSGMKRRATPSLPAKRRSISMALGKSSRGQRRGPAEAARRARHWKSSQWMGITSLGFCLPDDLAPSTRRRTACSSCPAWRCRERRRRRWTPLYMPGLEVGYWRGRGF